MADRLPGVARGELLERGRRAARELVERRVRQHADHGGRVLDGQRRQLDRHRRAPSGAPAPPSPPPRRGRRPVAAATARWRWYDAPRAGMSSTDASSAEQPSRSATGASRSTSAGQVVGDQRLVGVGVEDDDRVEPVAGGPPLVLLHVPRRHHRQLPRRRPAGCRGRRPGSASARRARRGRRRSRRRRRPGSRGCPGAAPGRTSQRTSVSSSITPVVTWSPTYDSNSAHVVNWNGSPAVGSCWNISARLEA